MGRPIEITRRDFSATALRECVPDNPHLFGDLERIDSIAHRPWAWVNL